MRLIESRRVREGRKGSAIASAVLHAAIVAAAVVATRATVQATAPDPDQGLVWIAPPPVAQPGPRTGGRALGDAGQTSTTAPRPELPRLPLPGDVVVDVEGPALPGPALPDPFGRGGAPDGARTGDATGGNAGAPADGVWSDRHVEVAVVPDPRNPVPAYPDPLRVAGIGGRVLVEFVVDTTGQVRPGTLRVLESAHPLFTVAVRRTAPSLRFTSARVRGRAVAQLVRMPLEFEVR